MPKLSVIVVSFNSRVDLDACLASIAASEARIDYEIVVIDNASTDGTAEHLRQRWPGVRVVQAGANLGFAKANNLGIRQTFGELVLLLNPDTIVPRGTLDSLAGVLERRPDVAIAGPRIVDGHGRAELSFGRMISPLAELRQKVLVRGSDRGLAPIRALVERMTRRTREVDWVSGACLLIRRADLEAAGLLDERFFMYAEDVDLCASVRAGGRKVLFAAEVEVVHLRGRSAATAMGAVQRAYRDSQIAFYEKHHPRWVGMVKAYLKLRGIFTDKPHIVD